MHSIFLFLYLIVYCLVIVAKTIVAAGSLIAKKFTRGNVIIGGISAKVLTDEVEWMAQLIDSH